MNVSIELKNVSKKYDNLTVLNDITYSFQEQKIYGIIGSSGVGKTTLLQLMGTLDSPSCGEIIISNQKTSILSTKEKAHLRNKHIGFVFQSYFLNSKLSAIENVLLPMMITDMPIAQCKEQASFLLTQLGLINRINCHPNQLYGGEQQRVAIARAFDNNPAIILADEPTGNLDKENEQHIMQIFKHLCKIQKKTIIMVTHNESLLNQMDEVLLLKNQCLQKY